MNKKAKKNNKNKKILIALITSIVILIGSTFAWYIITVKGTSENVIKVGTLSLVLDESESIALSLDNSLPMTDSEGLNTAAYTFKLKNNGTINSQYTIYLDDVELEDGEARMLDEYVKYSLTKDDEEAVTALLSTTGENPNRVLDSGIIEKDTTQVYTLRLWIDKDADNAVMNTTFSGKLRVEATQTTQITEESQPLCKRATEDTLHAETCSQTDTSIYCGADGYSNGDTITYGSTGTSGTLTTGDAFDCDVDGNEEYNSETERFYYVTDMNSDTAVLIYYNNVSEGVASNSTTYAYNSQTGYYGPATGKLQLPKTTQWSNVSLTNTTRNLKDDAGTTRVTGFSYDSYAARLITYQEVETGCYDGKTAINSKGGLSSKCKFLFENTKYSNNSMATYGFWLETPRTSNSNLAWFVAVSYHDVNSNYVNNSSGYGVRPAIEVSKSNILY